MKSVDQMNRELLFNESQNSRTSVHPLKLARDWFKTTKRICILGTGMGSQERPPG